MHLMSIRFEDEVMDRLRNEATDRLVSINWLVNRLCDEGLDRLVDEIKVTT